MEYILHALEMKAADENTQAAFHIPQAVLMERAAMAALCVMKLEKLPVERVLIACGPGNNGGDGFALGRLLMEQGAGVDFAFIGDRSRCTDIENEQISAVKAMNPDIFINDGVPEGVDYTTVVDAILGISLNRPLTGIFLENVRKINDLHDRGCRVVSLDIPTGINAVTGVVMGDAIKADFTVAFAFKKIGNVLFPGAQYCGKLVKASIGINDRALVAVPVITAYESRDIVLPERRPYSNKGTYGKVLIAAGSENMSGAATLSSLAAFRTGCGMVRIHTPESNRVILQETVPEAIINSYQDDDPLHGLDEAFSWCDVVAVGPGISKSAGAVKIVEYILKNSPVPIVIDADGLNIISDRPEMLSECTQDVIITPHIGEMSRLTGISAKEIESHLIDTASDFAKGYNVVCVLKDARTVIADTAGRICINLNGNDGMATAGSGDVLTGVIASLKAQGLDSFTAASLGCAVHGKAGDAASAEIGRPALMARDIIDRIR